jgi:sulfide:quinone oxidoreductase
MPQHIVIVGGGVGGTIVANLLARSLHHQEAEITLIDSTGKHAYMPGWLYLPFNHVAADSDQLIRPERDLLNNHIHLVTGEVQKIDVQNRELHVHHSQGLDEILGTGGASQAVYPYDYLVLATGARLVS